MATVTKQEVVDYLAQRAISVDSDVPMMYAEKDTRGVGAAFGAIGQLAASRFFIVVFAHSQMLLVRLTLTGKIDTQEDVLIYDPSTTKITMKPLLFGIQYKTVLTDVNGGKLQLLASNAKNITKFGYNMSSEIKMMFGFPDK